MHLPGPDLIIWTTGLTTSAASVPALLLSSEAVDGPAAPPASLVSPLSSLCLRRELAHAVS